MDGIDFSGFSAPVTLGHLHQTGCGGITTRRGVYVVSRSTSDRPVFRQASPAGWVKGLDPSYPVEFAESNWVRGARVLYVGKAEGRRGLRDRISALVRFGFGAKASHRGGRLLWQLVDCADLELRWMEVDNARTRETGLIQKFRDVYGTRPFANLVK